MCEEGPTAEQRLWDGAFLFGFVTHLFILHILAEPPSQQEALHLSIC